jgi:hypothetical protein
MKDELREKIVEETNAFIDSSRVYARTLEQMAKMAEDSHEAIDEPTDIGDYESETMGYVSDTLIAFRRTLDLYVEKVSSALENTVNASRQEEFQKAFENAAATVREIEAGVRDEDGELKEEAVQ